MINLPNLLTGFRILLVPLLVVVLLTKPKIDYQEFVGLGIFLLASLTDVLDGFIARRRRQVTRLGKLLDPAADKILTSAAFISMALPLLVFFSLQRYFVRGLTAGSVKG